MNFDVVADVDIGVGDSRDKLMLCIIIYRCIDVG